MNKNTGCPFDEIETMRKSEDKELEDAALEEFHSYSEGEYQELSYRTIVLESFKAGYKVHQDKSANDAIEFAEWLHCNQFVRYIQSKDGPVPFGENKNSDKNIWVSTKIHYSPDFYTTEQLYEIYKSKNK